MFGIASLHERFVVMLQHMLQYWHDFQREGLSKLRPHFAFHLLLHDAWRLFPLQDLVFAFSADLYSYVNVWKDPFYRELQTVAHKKFRTFFPQSLTCWLKVNCGEQAVGWLCSQSWSSVVLMSQYECGSMRKFFTWHLWQYCFLFYWFGLVPTTHYMNENRFLTSHCGRKEMFCLYFLTKGRGAADMMGNVRKICDTVGVGVG